MFGPGLVDDDLVSNDGYRTGVKDTIYSKPLMGPKGLVIEVQGAMHFNLAQNTEWYGSANNKFNVELFLGHFAQKDGKSCTVTLKSTVQPTAAASTSYSVSLKDQFTVSEACGLSGLDAWTESHKYPLLEVKFSAVQANAQTPNAASKYQTQFKLSGPIYFQ
jgi:hypothetical protein